MSPYAAQLDVRTMKSSIETLIARQHLLLSTITALLQLANKAERTWTRRSRSCIRLRQRCIDFACQFQSILGLTLSNLIRDYVRIKDVKILLLQLRDEGAKNILVLHGKLKQTNDELKRGSRASLIEQSAGSSLQPPKALLACHIRDAQILLGTIRGTNLDSSNLEAEDRRALLEAASSLADSVDSYLPGCAVLLRGSRLELLSATLESLLTSMQSLMGDTKGTDPVTNSPHRIFSRVTSLPAQVQPLPNLAESSEKVPTKDEDSDHASMSTLVVHNIDEIKWTRS